MSIILAYPTLASYTSRVVLGDVEQLPQSRPSRVLQSVFETDAGTRVVYDWGAVRKSFSLTLYPLTQAEVDALRTFFTTTVRGQSRQWQIQDSLARSYTVQFAMEVFDPQMTGVGVYSLALTVQEV